MRAIKIFVIVSALLLLAGLGVLVATALQRSPAKPPASPAIVEETISLPSGSKVTRMTGMGTSGVALLARQEDGGAQLLLFSAHGQLQRRIRLTPASPTVPSADHSQGN
ncbi:MAG: hypothetical protein HQL96_00190 [Magnetococcales bacterium]|nr:hypothetical protein [Magnetococcales bacterium]